MYLQISINAKTHQIFIEALDAGLPTILTDGIVRIPSGSIYVLWDRQKIILIGICTSFWGVICWRTDHCLLWRPRSRRRLSRSSRTRNRWRTWRNVTSDRISSSRGRRWTSTRSTRTIRLTAFLRHGGKTQNSNIVSTQCTILCTTTTRDLF